MYQGPLWGTAHRNQAKKIKLPQKRNFVTTCGEISFLGGNSKFLS